MSLLRRLRAGRVVLVTLAALTVLLLAKDLLTGTAFWGELLEVPLFGGLLIGLLIYAHRAQVALDRVARLAQERAELLEHQERLLHDVSHELRTPVTIARGHLEVAHDGAPETAVAIDELDRIAHIVDQLLLLAKAEQPNSLQPADIDLEAFVEDVFLRWSEVAERVWRLGPVAAGTLHADPHRLRVALDALLENAVEHTESADSVELLARDLGGRDRDRRQRRRDRDPLRSDGSHLPALRPRGLVAHPPRRRRRARPVDRGCGRPRARRRLQRPQLA